MIKFVSDLSQVGGFLRSTPVSSPNKTRIFFRIWGFMLSTSVECARYEKYDSVRTGIENIQLNIIICIKIIFSAL